ncbi:hypothetical protein [Paramuribaculum intestinale]|nr:hypothetical protein [Paramuribaculum intestinale]
MKMQLSNYRAPRRRPPPVTGAKSRQNQAIRTPADSCSPDT